MQFLHQLELMYVRQYSNDCLRFIQNDSYILTLDRYFSLSLTMLIFVMLITVTMSLMEILEGIFYSDTLEEGGVRLNLSQSSMW